MRRLWTLRTQLTLLYAVAFAASGAALLSVPLLQASQTEPATPGGLGPVGNGPEPPPDVSPLVRASIFSLLIMVVVSFALGWFIAGRLLRPLRTMTLSPRQTRALVPGPRSFCRVRRLTASPTNCLSRLARTSPTPF